MITTAQAEPFKHCTEVLLEDLMWTRCPGHHSIKMKHQLLLRCKIMQILSLHRHFREFNTCIRGNRHFFRRLEGPKKMQRVNLCCL